MLGYETGRVKICRWTGFNDDEMAVFIGETISKENIIYEAYKANSPIVLNFGNGIRLDIGDYLIKTNGGEFFKLGKEDIRIEVG